MIAPAVQTVISKQARVAERVEGRKQKTWKMAVDQDAQAP
jgi:hypothetical protein